MSGRRLKKIVKELIVVYKLVLLVFETIIIWKKN